MISAMSDKRLYSRFPARFPAKFQHERSDFGTNVFLRDASAGGMKIATTERLFLNDSVALEVDLPDGFEPLVLSGRVSWVKGQDPDLWEVGVSFHKTNLMKLHRMFRLVSQED